MLILIIPKGILTEAFHAADTGNWALFLKLMDGPAPLRENIAIHIARIETDKIGKYGDPIGKKLWGLAAGKIQLHTRTVKWRQGCAALCAIYRQMRRTRLGVLSITVRNTYAKIIEKDDFYSQSDKLLPLL